MIFFGSSISGCLSHEETEMDRFLKDDARVDKTPAGKMMARLSKVLQEDSRGERCFGPIGCEETLGEVSSCSE